MTLIADLEAHYGDPKAMDEKTLDEAINHELTLCIDARRIWTMASKRHEELLKIRSERRKK